MSQHLAGALSQGPIDPGDGGVAYRFMHDDGTAVDVVWGAGHTSLPTEAREAQAYSLSGQKLPTDVSGGAIHVDVTDDPVFVEHSVKVFGIGPVTQVSNNAPGTPSGPPSNNPPPPTNNSAPPPTQNFSPPPPAQNFSQSPPPQSFSQSPVSNAPGGWSTWIDTEQRLQLQYPSNWQVTRLAATPQNLLELDGPDGVLYFLEIYDQRGTPATLMADWERIHQQSTVYYYADNYVLDTGVGGEPGKLLNFAYTAQNDLSTPPRTGKLWVVTHGGKEYDFQGRNQSAHAAEVDAITASVVFLR
jgi:hypothetical protein